MTRIGSAGAGGRFAVAHLSDEAVAAFADGVLRDGARARAEQHLGDCAECREAVRGQRAASAVLRSAPLPCLPAGLADRLRDLADTTPLGLAGFAPAALSPDSQPMFAAFHVRAMLDSTDVRHASPDAVTLPRAVEVVPDVIGVAGPGSGSVIPLAGAPAGHASPAMPAHHRFVSTAGLGVVAVTVVTVSLLASTAASAGGAVVSGTPAAAPVSTPAGAPSGQLMPDRQRHGSVVQFDLTGPR